MLRQLGLWLSFALFSNVSVLVVEGLLDPNS
jgi:hypothetical protein